MLHSKTKETENSLCLCIIHTHPLVSADVREQRASAERNTSNSLSCLGRQQFLKQICCASDTTQGDVAYIPD